MHSKQYTRLLNSKRWKTLRADYLRAHPLCELCQESGYVRAAVDVHHRTPVESEKTEQGMERLAFDWANLQALCIPCHVRLHKEQGRATRANHQQRERARLASWLERHTGGAPTEAGASVILEEKKLPNPLAQSSVDKTDFENSVFPTD